MLITNARLVNEGEIREVDVLIDGDAYDDAYAHARVLEKEQGLVFIHPFDDPLVIAGQGTIGAEITGITITALLIDFS